MRNSSQNVYVEYIKNIKFYLDIYEELCLIKSIAKIPANKFIDYYLKQIKILAGNQGIETLRRAFMNFISYVREFEQVSGSIYAYIINMDVNNDDEREKKNRKENLLYFHKLIQKYWKNYIKYYLDDAEKHITNSIDLLRQTLLEK